MSGESPFKVVVSEDGISCRVEWDAHYISDEDMQLIAERFDELKRENAELRELVADMWRFMRHGCRGCEHRRKVSRGVHACELGECAVRLDLMERTRELGIEVEE